MKKKVICLVIGGAVLCLASAWLLSSCGSSSSSSDSDSGSSYSVTASVAVPTTANVSSSLKSVGLGKAITEEVAAGALVEAQDTAGTVLGSCTTGADGTCTVSLTAAQLQAGVVFAAQGVHGYREYNATDIAAAAAGTALTAAVNTEEDVVYGMLVASCEGDMAACPPTNDRECLHDAMEVLAGDDEPGTSTIDGYVEALVQGHANAIVNGGAANAGPALIAALGGDVPAYTSVIGSDTVSNVLVADAVANGDLAADTIHSAYCTRPSAGADSPWETARVSATDVDRLTFNVAVAGMIEYFVPSELREGLYPPASFQGFMDAARSLDGYFTTAGSADAELARRAFVVAFQQGMFLDPLNAPVAVGFVAATFPAPVNNVRDWTGNAYDPATAGVGARNAFMDFTNSGSYAAGQFTPNQVHSAFQSVLGDPTYRTTFVNGGGGDFVSAFMGDPMGFVPRDHMGVVKSSPGGSCTTSSDCLPCDGCVSSVCVAGSAKMGSTCSSDSDCDDVTLCAGPPDATYAAVAGRSCMCRSAVPMGIGVYTGSGGPQQYGMTGGYTPPANGAQGGFCDPTNPCGAGLTCTNSTYGGVCAPGTFKFGMGMPCTANDNCLSNSCVGGFCAASAGETGTKANGQLCAMPRECVSGWCTAGVCSPAGGGTGLKPDGSTCSTGAECMSGFCGSYGGGNYCMQQGGLPTGSFCNIGAVCASFTCDFAHNTCF